MDENIHIHSHPSPWSFKIFFIFIPILIFVTTLAFFVRSAPRNEVLSVENQEPTNLLVVNGKQITIETMQTPAEKAKGLGGTQNLTDNEGMLFDFKNEFGLPGFWMKDMVIPIDIIWIKNGEVIQIDKNVPPQPQDIVYSPPAEVLDIDYVLEVAAGFSDRYGINVGTQIDL